MKILKTFIFMMTLCAILLSCEKEETGIEEVNQEIPTEVFEKLINLGVNPTGAVPHTFENLEGKKESGWLAHDIFLSNTELKEMEDLPSIDKIEGQKLYRTFNLVRVPNQGRRTITVRGRSLPQKLRTGLRRAVANYNQLNLRFRLVLSFGNNNGGKNIIVFNNNSNGAGAIARFPGRGNPGRTIEVDRGVVNQPINNIEHLMTHELGHCFGLRHSDLGTRRSCGQNVDEQDSSEGRRFGAIFIPGTSRNRDSQNSVMRACYSNESGNFFQQDRTALRRLY